jgi:hypothetical protein
MTASTDEPTVRLRRYHDDWREDDPNAAFKEEVAAVTRADPTETLSGLSALTGIEIGALARYVLVRWASDGAAAVMELGPRLVGELCAVVEQAEARGTDAARLEAFERVRAVTAQLRLARERPPVDPA